MVVHNQNEFHGQSNQVNVTIINNYYINTAPAVIPETVSRKIPEKNRPSFLKRIIPGLLYILKWPWESILVILSYTINQIL